MLKGNTIGHPLLNPFGWPDNKFVYGIIKHPALLYFRVFSCF